MTIAIIIATSIIAWTICAILRAPIGFQTDRGFFYGVPDQQERHAKHAAEGRDIGPGALTLSDEMRAFHTPSSDIPGAK